MSDAKAYVIIAILAVASGLLAFTLDESKSQESPSSCGNAEGCRLESLGILLPFWDQPVVPSNITVIANGAKPTAIAENLGHCEASERCATIQWHGNIGHVNGGPTVAIETALSPLAPRNGTGLVFGQDTWSVQGIIYAFSGDGLLIASSDTRSITVERNGELVNESTTQRFPKHPDFMQFSSLTYYLGPGTPPRGTFALPMFADEARAALMGAKVGSVVSAQSDEFDWLFDRLYFTFKVTDLPQA